MFASVPVTRRDFIAIAAMAAVPLLADAEPPLSDQSPKQLAYSRAKAAWDAFIRVYWAPRPKLFFKDGLRRLKVLDFWLTAHAWECVMDAQELFKIAETAKLVDDVYAGFCARERDWKKNPFNDDLMWWVMACMRAYRLTGKKIYLDRAQATYDRVAEKEIDETLGGGMWWKSDEHKSKNACVNCPAIIGACELYQATRQRKYLDQAKAMYQWVCEKLFDPATGAVWDSMNLGGKVWKATFTYNQGTFIRSGMLLDKLCQLPEAADRSRKTINFLLGPLSPGGVMKGEGQGDGGAFKQIAIRALAEWIAEPSNQGKPSTRKIFDALSKNAEAAWENQSEGPLFGPDWHRAGMPPRRIECETDATAVSLLLTVARLHP